MNVYEYGRIHVLAKRLEENGVAPEIVAPIMEGGETISKTASGAKKAAWLKGAMERMDGLLDLKTRRTVREGCACCLGGERLKQTKAIAKKFATLEERIEAANAAKLVFGHSVTREENGSIVVRFHAEDERHYGCPCLPKAEEALPITYCYCCEGHVKHHLQTALGLKLEGQVVSSSLSSGGVNPCVFRFHRVD